LGVYWCGHRASIGVRDGTKQKQLATGVGISVK
jgi:hypothetical protein